MRLISVAAWGGTHAAHRFAGARPSSVVWEGTGLPRASMHALSADLPGALLAVCTRQVAAAQRLHMPAPAALARLYRKRGPAHP